MKNAVSVLLFLSSVACWASVPTRPYTASKPALTDVEELNDKLLRYEDKTVAVVGEIQDKIGRRAFVLESGGIIDDEIIVLVPDHVRGERVVKLPEDEKINVIGQVRIAPLDSVLKDLGWEMDLRTKTALMGAKGYLVAEEIQKALN